MSDPLVTVVVGDGGAARAALERQTLRSIEAIDAAPGWAARARGRWIARLDAGDAMHPDRLRRLFEAGERAGVDAVCDDVMTFDPAGRRAPRTTLPGRLRRGASMLDPGRAADARLLTRLMPMLRRSAWREGAITSPALCLPEPLYLRNGAARPAPRDGRDLVVLSRQRVAGATNGSSAYLLSVCDSLREAGWRVRYLGPTPATFGRWPLIPLPPEMDAFDRIELRGGLRLGRWLIALDPRRAARAAGAAIARLARRLGLSEPAWDKPAAYAIGLPWTRAEAMYVARRAQGCAAVLCDYAHLAALAPFTGAPPARVAALMHDLVHARAGAFAALGGADSVAALPAEEEFRLLAQAGAIVAIQSAEASQVRAALPGAKVIVAPMAARPAAAAQPGEDGIALFVGGGAAPNVDALSWFLGEVWPRVRAAAPTAELLIAGAAGPAAGACGPGVRLLGPVRRLAPLYARAGVVIAPLRVGSGLKIKLVEAMAEGKAIVATATALQGVESAAAHGVTLAKEPGAFAGALTGLLFDRAARAQAGAAALAYAKAHFGADAAHRDLRAWFGRPA